MGHKALEELITDGGRVVYTARMEFDSNQRLFAIDLKFDPESDRVDKILVFFYLFNLPEDLEHSYKSNLPRLRRPSK
jgi:hypothetical protein